MTEVRSNVTWLFCRMNPKLIFVPNAYQRVSADDHLIASVLYFSRQSGARPIVATADIGLKTN